MFTYPAGIVAIKKGARLITANHDIFIAKGLVFMHGGIFSRRDYKFIARQDLLIHNTLSVTMPKKAKKSKETRGLNRKQIIGLGLIFIFIISTIALAVSFSGL
jgi:hypothetical protein